MHLSDRLVVSPQHLVEQVSGESRIFVYVMFKVLRPFHESPAEVIGHIAAVFPVHDRSQRFGRPEVTFSRFLILCIVRQVAEGRFHDPVDSRLHAQAGVARGSGTVLPVDTGCHSQTAISGFGNRIAQPSFTRAISHVRRSRRVFLIQRVVSQRTDRVTVQGVYRRFDRHVLWNVHAGNLFQKTT